MREITTDQVEEIEERRAAEFYYVGILRQEFLKIAYVFGFNYYNGWS